MSVQRIRITPPTVHVEIYAGDESTFSLTVLLDDEPRDVSGTHLAQVKVNRGDSVAVAEIDVTTTGEPGECTFTIDADTADEILDAGTVTEQTTLAGVRAVVPEFTGEWDWQHTDGADVPVTYAQGKFTVYADVSRPA